MPKLTKIVYAAVRLADGHEYIDPSSVAVLRDIAASRAADLDHMLPSWSKDNQIVRIAACQLTELDEESE